ncbi:MAG: ATP cone domain-containing protein [Candidatus Caldarchaeum sp.]
MNLSANRPNRLKAMPFINPVMMVVERDGERILDAVTDLGKRDIEAARKVTDEAVNTLVGRGVENTHVEEIQDLLELSLMRLKPPITA